MASQREYFPELTGVRAVMMYCVFLCHFNLFPRGAAWDPWDLVYRFSRELHIGVPVFYVLSGFLIYYRYGHELSRLNLGWLGRYAQNRFARIYPVYFLVLLFTYLRIGFPDIRETLVTFTLTQAFFDDLWHSGIAQAWTLTIEETFYFSAPLIFLVARRWGVAAACAIVAAAGALLVAVPFVGNSYYGRPDIVFGRTLCGTIACFGCGIYLAKVILARRGPLETTRKPYVTYGATAAAALVVLAVSRLTPLPEFSAPSGSEVRGVEHPLGGVLIFTLFPVFVGLAFFGLITERSLLKRLLASKLLVLLGGSSYCFYLIHLGVVQRLLDQFIGATLLTATPAFIDPYWTMYIARFLLLNVVAVAMFKLIEKPANIWIKDLGRHPKRARAWSREAAYSYGMLAIVVAVLQLAPWAAQAIGGQGWVDWLLREDGPYESIEAILCAAAAVAFWYSFLILSRRSIKPPGHVLQCTIIAAWGVLLVIMFGEEVSWGQRLFGFESPRWLLVANYQGEATLHNLDIFQTSGRGNLLQNLWLMSMVAYVGISPFVVRAWNDARPLRKHLALVLPSLPVAAIFLVSLVAYIALEQPSEVLEVIVDVLLLAFSLEVFAQCRTASDRQSRNRLALAMAACVGLLLMVLPLQSGEAALPSVRSAQLSDAGTLALTQGRPNEAAELYSHALRIWPRNLAAANNLAWIRATCVDPTLRDGGEAVRLAEGVCQATGYKNPSYVSTLAAAHAEARQFDQAVALARRALDEVPNGAPHEVIAELRRRVEHYTACRPLRQ